MRARSSTIGLLSHTAKISLLQGEGPLEHGKQLIAALTHFAQGALSQIPFVSKCANRMGDRFNSNVGASWGAKDSLNCLLGTLTPA